MVHCLETIEALNTKALKDYERQDTCPLENRLEIKLPAGQLPHGALMMHPNGSLLYSIWDNIISYDDANAVGVIRPKAGKRLMLNPRTGIISSVEVDKPVVWVVTDKELGDYLEARKLARETCHAVPPVTAEVDTDVVCMT